MTETATTEKLLLQKDGPIGWITFHDPLAAAVLSMAEIRKMVREMLKKNRKYLPRFKTVNI